MAPPTPFHIIRHHSHPIHQVAFSSSSSPRYLYTGDEQGTVSIIDLGKRRVVASWKANEGGVLGVGEWDGGLIRWVVGDSYRNGSGVPNHSG